MQFGFVVADLLPGNLHGCNQIGIAFSALLRAAWLQGCYPACFLTFESLRMLSCCHAVMVSIDVKDAFLTVSQETPTVVRCQLADGTSMGYSLGKVLPGQRDGSLLCHKDITGLLKTELAMAEHIPYPCILKTPGSSCVVLVHVDNILVVGRRSFVQNKLVKRLEKSYSVSTQFVEKPGDELSFFKRTTCLQHDGRLTIKTQHKHIQHLCGLLRLNPRLQNKKTPGH